MRSAAIYASRPSAHPADQEALILVQLDAALSTRTDIERRDLAALDRKNTLAAPSLPGLSRVRPCEEVIALGCAAHIALADFEKRTLIAGDLDLGGPREARHIQDIESFVWSCINTSRIVALGSGAWHSVQLLPVADRRCQKVPPLRLDGGPRLKQNILVIDHKGERQRAQALVDVLDLLDLPVQYAGPQDASCWSNDALVHVHVGDHTLDAEMPRLVDSWRSERVALQMADDRRLRRPPNPEVLRVEDGVNGIICATPEAVASVCLELWDDRVLRQKLIAAGQSTVAPLMRGWGVIAEDLLA